MSHVLEYTLSLQDKMSAKLKQIGISSDSALNKFAHLQSQSLANSKLFNEMGKSVYTLQQRLNLLKNERDLIPESNLRDLRIYNSEIEKLTKKITNLQNVKTGGFFKRNISDALSMIPGAGLLTNPLVIAGTIAAGAFREGFRSDMQSVAFETLLGSKAKGDKMFGDIRQFAAITPYETLPLADNAKMMLGFGIAQDKIMPNLKMLGDIAMGDANKMNSLTLAFSQSSSAGKLNGQDLLQMINAGFNPLQIISEKTGKSMGFLRKEMEKGHISVKMVQSAFESATGPGGRFYQMTEKMGNSPMGKWSTFIDNLKQSLLKIYDIISPLVIPALNLMNNFLEWLMNTIVKVNTGLTWLWTKIKEGNPIILIITVLVGSLTAAMILMNAWIWAVNTATKIWAAAQMFLNATMYANPITWIIAGIIALIAIIAYVVYKTDGWGKQWESIVNFMKYTFLAYVEKIKFAWNVMVNGIMWGLDLIKLGWYKFKEAIGLGDSSENKNAIAKINADMKARQQAVVDGAKKVFEYEQKAKDSLKWELSWNNSRKLSDVTDKLKEKIGISTPDKSASKVGTGGSSSMDVSDNITSGGSKPTNITIHLGKLMDSVNIHSQNLKEGTQDMEKIVVETLLRVLNSGNAIAGR
ncbi:MAG: tape measure protein [Bacteroidetes bacterium]|nr:tape measure protein [Bacteroidota bacterium]